MIHEWKENRAKRKKGEQKVWESGEGEGEAVNVWLKVKMKRYFN